jgi:NAD dependent epimerase/dehydratase family enzyme
MIAAISGSTGFIGRSLIRKMRENDWTIRAINRDSFALSDRDFLEQKTEGSDVIINLAGAPVSQKWTPEYKQEILRSRIDTTRKITGSIIKANAKPAVFISASAVGIYDSENLHTESSTAFAGTFLADVCRNWEQEAMQAADLTRLAPRYEV